MRTDGRAIRRHEIVIPHVDPESLKAWAKATFTRERVAVVALCASTATVIGLVLFSLHRAMGNITVLGF